MHPLYLLLTLLFFAGTLSAIDQGIWAASLTPMHEDLSCDNELLAEHCQDLIKRGCKGVVLFGTTGEGPSLTAQEKEEVLSAVIDQELDPEKIIVGTGSANLMETVAVAKASLAHGCTACLISPPSFFKGVTEEGVIQFYREVIQRVDNPNLQILLYHIPQYTSVPLSPRIVKTLIDEYPETIIGFKESEGNPDLIKEILKLPIQVFLGKEGLLPEFRQAGIAGSISGKANLFPELICSLYDGTCVENYEILFEKLKQHPFIATCKAHLKWKHLRPPLYTEYDSRIGF